METFVILRSKSLSERHPYVGKGPIRSVTMAYTPSGSRRKSPRPKNGARHFSRPRAPKMSADVTAARSMACV